VPMDAGPAEVPGRAAELMGKSCRNAPRRAERCRICDGDVIVGVVMPGDLIGIPDDDPYRVRVGGSEPEAVHVVAVGGGLLRAHMLTCPICRRKMGWGMVVQLDAWTKLPAPLRVALQQAAGYEAADPLSVAELGQPPTRAPTAKAPSCEAPRAP